MATGPGFPSATNTFIPNWEASGRLAVQYTRNVKDFQLNKWVQLVQSPKVTGYYLKMSAQEAARVAHGNDYLWSWDSVRPMHPEGLESFNFLPFSVKRYDYGFNLGTDTVDQADWNVAEQHARIHAAKGMTHRTIRAITALTTTTNWNTTADPDLAADHFGTATALAGGYLDQGTAVAPLLKKALDKIAVKIDLDTLGTVRPDQLHVIFNPNTARLLAESPEIHEYIKGSPAALDEIKTGTSPNARYGPGLPSSIYGYKVIVENTMKVTSRKGETLVKAYAFPDQTIAVAARPGELEGVVGPSFSTMTLFWYRDEMTLERFEDPKNRLMEYHVTDCTAEILTAPASGYLITSATSVAS